MALHSATQDREIQTSVGDELPPGTALCGGQYVIEKFLNAGGFGVTYLARDSLDRKVVIKECFPNSMCCRSGPSVRLRSKSFEQDFSQVVELFQKEARALARLQHPSIVGVHQIFEQNDTAYMAIDFVNGMDLFELMANHPDYLTPAVIEPIVLTLLNALTYVHEHGILHRDISPDNILLDANGAPVLIDFGAARLGSKQFSKIVSRVYTVKDGYSPHEFYFEGAGQSQASDLYALAATVVHLITGKPPPSSSARLASISEERPDPFQPLGDSVDGFSENFIWAVDRCMSLFAKDRLQTAAAWRDAICGARPVGVHDKAPPVMGAELVRQVAELVASNHEALAREAAERAKRPVDVEPVVDPDAERRAAERAYWAMLNEDLDRLAEEAELERQAEAEDLAADETEPPEPDLPEPASTTLRVPDAPTPAA